MHHAVRYKKKNIVRDGCKNETKKEKEKKRKAKTERKNDRIDS